MVSHRDERQIVGLYRIRTTKKRHSHLSELHLKVATHKDDFHVLARILHPLAPMRKTSGCYAL